MSWLLVLQASLALGASDGLAHSASGSLARSASRSLSGAIEGHFDELYSTGALNLQGEPILAGTLLTRIYELRDYRPAWDDPARVDELLEILSSAGEDGLDPEDYNVSALRSLRERARRAPDDVPRDELELLYSESLLRYAYHQRFGKVDPTSLSGTWNFAAEFAEDEDPAVTFNQAMAATSLADFQDQHLRRGPLYRHVKAALARYREIAAAGGWPEVAIGKTLSVGERDPAVRDLRRRLAVTGDLARADHDDVDLYDPPLEGAVKRFQTRHGLDVDGAVGPGTLAALNEPVAARIDQLRLTLERSRWLGGAIDPSIVLVNIASAEVHVVEDGQFIWSRRAMVGRTYRQTPTFRGLMTYLEINPTWTVPPGILRNDILPKVRQDVGYLDRARISVLDSAGKRIDPSAVDWHHLERVPYVFRQEPGPDNALGRIKFMFPNEHFVFLHDTPHRELFARSARTFSSGCIRVEDPFALASLLLRSPEQWSESAITAVVDSGETRRVRLPHPWPVYILYWTAEADQSGLVRFFPDVYLRDPPVLDALNTSVEDLPGPARRAAN